MYGRPEELVDPNIYLVYYSTCLQVYGRSEELVDEHQVQEISAYSTNGLNIKSNL